MSTRNHTPRNRGFRPETDALETRQLLSGVVSGMDSKGDAWTLRLTGPGTINVLKQNDASGNPAPLNSATDIRTITFGGTNPQTSRLVGTVVKGANSDGRVFFQALTQLPARSEKFPGSGLGLLSISMPNFWLGNTAPVASTDTPSTHVASISLPDGVETFQFGGVDTTFGSRPPATSTTPDNQDTIIMGLPLYGGTRILINQSISSTTIVPATTGTTPTPAHTVQHGVKFIVSGRLDLFQANQIVGDSSNPPGQFTNENTAATGDGGTTVYSAVAGTQPLFPNSLFKGSVTGQIGDVRIGGNATNFITVVNDATGSGGDRISNFSIGGETNNVLLVAPNGSRNVVFGKGMDTVEIRSHVINNLQANRGALNSTVYVDRAISRVQLGGDVVNTKILSGYQQSFSGIFSDVTGFNGNNPFASITPVAPRIPTNAQIGGGMTVHVAGDVSNSVFAASVQPYNSTPLTSTPTLVFGDPNQLVLPSGRIRGKIEGKIDNSIATPSTPTTAFFAQNVQSLAGPVIPPNVPEAPYTGPQTPAHLPGIKVAQAATHATTKKSTVKPTKATALKTSATSQPVTVGSSTPQGPSATTTPNA